METKLSTTNVLNSDELARMWRLGGSTDEQKHWLRAGVEPELVYRENPNEAFPKHRHVGEFLANVTVQSVTQGS